MSFYPDQPITKTKPFRICFVCLGNICRSPTAEGVFQHLVHEKGLQAYFEIDSAGTSAYHIGEGANSKSQHVAQQHGITLHSKARRFETFDLGYFNLIVAMDRENLSNIKKLDEANDFADKIILLRAFDPSPGDKSVPDPYYDRLNGFQNVFQIIERSCKALLDDLAKHIIDEHS